MKKTHLPTLLALLLLSISALPAFAIVIRHDRNDEDYKKLGAQYPAAVTVLPDGTGTLVAPRWVLTAAHVARGAASRNPRVVIAGEEYEVERLYLHPDWSKPGDTQDIALMQLRRPAEGVTPVLLHEDASEVGRVVTFVGRGDFGTGLTGPQQMDGHLRGATNTVQSVDSDWIYFTFDQGEGATELEGVSGPGDSGGPALVEIEGRLHTLGVSAMAMGKPGRYGVREAYTRVSTHASWIRSVMAGTSGDQGIAPTSETARPRRSDQGEGHMAAISISGPSTLPDTPAGRLVGQYLEAYNSNDDELMGKFLRERATAELYGRRPLQQHLELYHRLKNELFGRLKLIQVREAEESEIVVLLEGEMGMAEMTFSFDPKDDFKMSKLRVAQVTVD